MKFYTTKFLSCLKKSEEYKYNEHVFELLDISNMYYIRNHNSLKMFDLLLTKLILIVLLIF